jgi:hypothetical protein
MALHLSLPNFRSIVRDRNVTARGQLEVVASENCRQSMFLNDGFVARKGVTALHIRNAF